MRLRMAIRIVFRVLIHTIAVSETSGASQNMMQATSLKAVSTMSIWNYVFMVWGMGLCISLVYYSIKHYKFIIFAKRWCSDVVDTDILENMERIRYRMGIRKDIGLTECSGITTPMLVGILRPKVLLPSNMTIEHIAVAIEHELTHYKRQDILYKALILFASSIHWFNPLVKWIAKEISILREISCD